jgi:hypothetical protein
VNQHPMNSTVQQLKTFAKQPILNHVPRNPEEERLALAYMNKHADDLIGMVLGGVL